MVESKKEMQRRRVFAVGTDDVGRVDAADIEVSTALQLLAEDPPPARDVAEEVLLGLEPAQALALCESSPFYQEICDSDGFKERYRRMWHVRVGLVDLRGFLREYFLLSTRNVGDVKGLYEQDFEKERTGYTFFYPPEWSGKAMTVPTAQSLLGGLAQPPQEGDRLAWTRFAVTIRPFAAPVDRILMHYFANGETIELSE